MTLPSHPIIECGLEIQFEFQCPKTWESLQPTKDAGTRFCQGCQKNVYLCRSKNDLTKHLLQKHCIAADVPHFKVKNSTKAHKERPRTARRLLGYPTVIKHPEDDIPSPFVFNRSTPQVYGAPIFVTPIDELKHYALHQSVGWKVPKERYDYLAFYMNLFQNEQLTNQFMNSGVYPPEFLKNNQASDQSDQRGGGLF